jgi:hypothetical protein
VKYEEDITRWSNAKKARFFLHVIAYLVIGKGGELKIPVDELKNLKIPLGLVVEDGHMVFAANLDDAPKDWVGRSAVEVAKTLEKKSDEAEERAKHSGGSDEHLADISEANAYRDAAALVREMI